MVTTMIIMNIIIINNNSNKMVICVIVIGQSMQFMRGFGYNFTNYNLANDSISPIIWQEMF